MILCTLIIIYHISDMSCIGFKKYKPITISKMEHINQWDLLNEMRGELSFGG